MSRIPTLVFSSLLLGLAAGQTPGGVTDAHPQLLTWKCTKADGCTKQSTSVVLDSLTHPLHQIDKPNVSCAKGTKPNPAVCPDKKTCAENCIIGGIADYTPHGVTTDGGSLSLKQIGAKGVARSPRVYLLADGAEKYEMLQLTGNELAFDVDVSKLPCGMNGALYLSEMDASGGKSHLNPAGAAYGTGYCDAQCFTDVPFINGAANLNGKGACCNEMDIWEANARSTQLAPHACNKDGLYKCAGSECGDKGVCDKDGCGQNPYTLGHHHYYGLDMTVDTSRPFTVVTQFPAENDKLTGIRRLYVQDGAVIQNVVVKGSESVITNDYCKTAGASSFERLGGLGSMGGALSRGMVLAMSIWWDESTFMTWLDSGEAGPCNATEGKPSIVSKIQPDTAVTFSNIKWGEIDSTYPANATGCA